jgi:hypothetical protein
MFRWITRILERKAQEKAAKAAAERERLLAKSLPKKWEEYRQFQCRWAEEGIYMLRQPTFEEWLFGNTPEVRADVQKLLRGAGL